MGEFRERRKEPRLTQQWPVWFAEGFGAALSQGIMVDISSAGMAFTCTVNDQCPELDQKITTQFSIPLFAPDGSSDMTGFTRIGRVSRIDTLDGDICRIVVQFNEPLSVKPCEQARISDTQQRLKSSMG